MRTHLVDKHDSGFMLEASVARDLCALVNTPRSLTVEILLRYEEYQQYVDLEINPEHYEEASAFADDLLVTEVLSKSALMPLDVDKRQVALDSFYESERHCAITNERLNLAHKTNDQQLVRVRDEVSRMLKPLTTGDLEFIEQSFRFGPGATTGAGGRGSTLSDKYDEETHLTVELIPYFKAIIGNTWWETSRCPVIVEGNRFTTVPKTAKTDRGICIEPTLNIYTQLGVGRMLRKRLRSFGVDLNSQLNNQRLAKVSYTANLATIDLSKASDSMSWSCVMSLVPPDWFDLLNLLRSSHTEIEKTWVELEKFSSMGNGYTFELESLIFTAILRSVVPSHLHHVTSVYGDDLVCPREYVSRVIETLEFFGFSVNKQKSYLAGSFFESCGTDWFKSQPVRPFYMRQQQGASQLPYRLQIANSLRLYANMRAGGKGCDQRFRPLWVALFQSSPKTIRSCKVPASLGDVGFIVSEKEANGRRLRDGWQGIEVRTLQMRPVLKLKTSVGLLLSVLASPGGEVPTYGRQPLRGYLRAIRRTWTPVFDWGPGLEWNPKTPK